jgi:hypothetical protein
MARNDRGRWTSLDANAAQIARNRELVVTQRKKLIEVALPLDAINKAAAREKSIRHGHPSTLHLWWARRPLAAARAVIFAQMVDDPSSYPDLFPTEKKQEKERQRLFRIIEELVQWESTTNEEVLQRARDEIWASWRRACTEYADHPRAKELFDRHKLPAFHDPFAGGGSLPLEAQRLGLEAHASDLNPVAVLVKSDVAKAQIARESGRTPTGEISRVVTGQPTAGVPVPPGSRIDGHLTPPAARILKRFYGSVELDPDRVGRDAGKIAEEVIQHLSTLAGASVRVVLEIEAQVEDGVPESTQRTVSENCKTLKFKSQGFEKA